MNGGAASQPVSMSIASTSHDYFARGFEAEMERARALDSKTANLMGFTSVLSGLMIPFTAIAEGQLAVVMAAWPPGRLMVQLLFVLAVLLLFGAVLFFYLSSRVRGYKQLPRFEWPDVEGWQSLSEEELLLRFARSYQRYWHHNKAQNDHKARWTQRGFLTLMLGGGAVVISVCWIIVASISAS